MDGQIDPLTNSLRKNVEQASIEIAWGTVDKIPGAFIKGCSVSN